MVGQLFPFCYVTHGEDADRSFPIYQPLLCLTIWLTGVVDETRPVALMFGINDFMWAAVSSISSCDNTVAVYMLVHACSNSDKLRVGSGHQGNQFTIAKLLAVVRLQCGAAVLCLQAPYHKAHDLKLYMST